jgi:colanic acid biosynthesis glycosyl transferase WcaI
VAGNLDLNILVVSQYFYPENFRINDLALGLIELGHDVTVLTGTPNYPEGIFFDGYRPRFKQETYKGIKVIRVPLVARGKKSKVLLALNYLSFALSASFIVPFLSLTKIDQIFIYGASPIFSAIPGIIVKFFTRAKTTLWVQDLWPESLSATQMIKNPLLIGMVGFCTRLIYAAMDEILITSKGFKSSINKYDTTKTPISYFPQWGEKIFEEQIIKEDLDVKAIFPEGFCVLFAGNIGVAQSLDIVIEAAEKLRSYEEIKFVLLGDGRDKARLKVLTQEKGLEKKIIFIDSYSIDFMPTFFSNADVLFLSLAKDPIFSITVPGKVQAYMASAKPIVTAVDGEASNLIKEAQCGFIGESEDGAAFAENILRAYSLSTSERNNLAANGRRYYMNNFRRDGLMDNLNKSFKENPFYY